MNTASSKTKLPPQEITVDVLLEKYAKGGETTAEEIYERVARHLSSVEKTAALRKKWEKAFYKNMTDGAIGAGRIMSASGTDLKTTLLNCYVVGVGDSIDGYDEDGLPGIYEALRQSACTMQKGGGVGYNFSKLRPKGSWVKSVKSTASGPCSYIDIFDASCATIESAGCFAGDTLISTTVGLLRIKDIVESDKDFYAVTHMGPKKVTAKFKNGIKPIVEITSKYGFSVKVTKDHKFAQYDGDEIVTRRIEDIIASDNHELITLKEEPLELITLNEWSYKNLPEEETYDLEVEDVHLLSGNGYYTSNSRRGAQLGAIDINHPDVLEFVEAKRVKGRWNNFNVSVLVNDDFMSKKDRKEPYELVHKAKPSQKQIDAGAFFKKEEGVWVYQTIDAQVLWDAIMHSNYEYAEPGILFYDNINNDNNLHYAEKLETTNPCGEVPLPPNGCCDLGPIILPMLVKHPFSAKAEFDFKKLASMTEIQVRMLDNVLDASIWPLEQQQKEAMSKRRIGVGFTGLANAIAMCNLVYYDADGLAMAEQICQVMKNKAYLTSIELAKEKGAFPLFNADQFLAQGTAASRLPQEIQDQIRAQGIRNSHLLSIAPTGTTSLAFADNASNGVEPPFSLAYTRKKRVAEGHVFYNVLDHSFRIWLDTLEDKGYSKAVLDAVCGYETEFVYQGTTYQVSAVLPASLVTAMGMTPEQHLAMMKVVQPYICQSISKTVNVPKDCSFEAFKTLYDQAWKYGLKGVSTYRPNDILGSVLSIEKPATPAEAQTEVLVQKSLEQVVSDLYTQPFESRQDGVLQGLSVKGRFHTEQGEQKFIVTINFIDLDTTTSQGDVVTVSRPVEFILTSSFTTSSSVWQSSMRFMSLLARSGVPVPKIIENMREITWEHGKVRYGTRTKDGKKVPMWHNSDVAAIGHVIQEALISAGYLTTDGAMTKRYKVASDRVEVEIPVVVPPALAARSEVAAAIPAGKSCPECNALALVKRDGCETCGNCGYIGSCG